MLLTAPFNCDKYNHPKLFSKYYNVNQENNTYTFEPTIITK